MRSTKARLLDEVKKEGFNSIEHFRDFYSVASNFADVDVPLTQCFELALESSILDDDERNDKAHRLSDIIINYYWHF